MEPCKGFEVGLGHLAGVGDEFEVGGLWRIEPGGAEEDDAAATVETSTSRGKRLFVGKLPLLLSVADLRTALGDEVRTVQWLTDRTSGHFYGSAFVEMATESACDALIARKKATKLGSKKIKMTRAPMREGEVWPPVGFEQRERPPIVL